MSAGSRIGSGSARVWRIGFGVSPKQSFLPAATHALKSPRKRDAFAGTRDACATRIMQ
jgi:hypothetical protein